MNDLVKSFCNVPVRNQLYSEVSSRTKIVLEPSTDTCWGSKTQGSETTIFYAPTRHPEASFAHELLHAKKKLQGYKQYCTAICRTPKRPLIARVLEILDNELPHHKFYAEFLALGFKPAEMYEDSDAEVANQLLEDIAGLKRDDPPELFLNSYVTIIAPGGGETEQERKNLEKVLEEKCPNRYWKKLRTIEAAIREFRDGPSLDAGPTIAQILRSLGDYEPTWVGTSDRFPDSGFFIGNPFTI